MLERKAVVRIPFMVSQTQVKIPYMVSQTMSEPPVWSAKSMSEPPVWSAKSISYLAGVSLRLSTLPDNTLYAIYNIFM